MASGLEIVSVALGVVPVFQAAANAYHPLTIILRSRTHDRMLATFLLSFNCEIALLSDQIQSTIDGTPLFQGASSSVFNHQEWTRDEIGSVLEHRLGNITLSFIENIHQALWILNRLVRSEADQRSSRPIDPVSGVVTRKL